jgi:hypothetical protein
MDPLGLTLENFDGVGSFRAQENGATINAASGTLDGHDFQGGAGLGQAIHDDPQTQRAVWWTKCIARQWAGTCCLKSEPMYVDLSQPDLSSRRLSRAGSDARDCCQPNFLCRNGARREEAGKPPQHAAAVQTSTSANKSSNGGRS